MKRMLENLKAGKKEEILILLLLGVLLLVIAIPTEEKNASPGESDLQQESEILIQRTKTEELEAKLQRVLSCAAGVGRTEVMITLKSDGQKIVEKDQEYSEGKEGNTNEGQNNSSETVSSSETTVYQKDSQGNETPYVTQELEPEIEGVLVLAQGADNAAAVGEITEAVMALFGVEAHKIKVMKME